MKRFVLIIVLCLLSSRIWSTPTTLYWTPCITDVVPTGLVDLTINNYFTVFNRPGHGQVLSPDVGLTLGLFSYGPFSAEAGIDYLGGTNYPLFFNGKIGILENKLFLNAPSFSIGVFDVGTKVGITNFNVFDVIAGKTLPDWLGGGRVFVAGFLGSHTLGKNRAGFMVGYLNGFCKTTFCDGTTYNKWVFVADYASGKNYIGGGGFGMTYYFTPRINLITGPTWFNDADFNGRWKWTVQTNFYFPLFPCRK